MALKTSLKFLGKRIAEGVRLAAKSEGLGPDDYRLHGTYEDALPRFFLQMATIKDVDRHSTYAKALREIQDRFPADPTFSNCISLVVRKFETPEDMEAFAYWNEAQEDISEFLRLSAP